MESVENLCRLCLNELVKEKKLIFDSYIEDTLVIDVMRKFCFKIDLDRNNNFPECICNECFEILENAYKLCEKSAQSERQLQLIISPDTFIKEEQIQDDYEFSSKLSIFNIISGGDVSMSADENIDSMVKTELKDLDYEDDEEEEEEDAETSVKEPKKSKKPENKYKCSTCYKSFPKPSKLARHEKTHDVNKKPFACAEPDCFQRFQTEASLKRHLIIHSGMTIKIGPDNKKWPCIICSKEFEAQEAMASHMRSHKDVMEKLTFPCNLCERVFKKLNELTRHSRTHVENRNYKCQICSKLFSQGSHLVDHLNRHNNIKPHACDKCGKAFQQHSTLKDHLLTHTDAKPYLCSTCGRGFNNPSNLRQHVKRHMNLKEFECHLCPSRFSCKASLQSHINSHNKIKNHTCQTCGSSFTKGSSLKKHIKTVHEGIKDHECPTCSMKFSSAEHLKRHSRTHTGERPYKCDKCEKTYAQSNDLLKHRRFHLGGDENIYKCTYENCNESFRLKALLRDHYIVHKTVTSD